MDNIHICMTEISFLFLISIVLYRNTFFVVFLCLFLMMALWKSQNM